MYRGDKGPLSGGLPIAAALKGVELLRHVSNFSDFADDLAGDYPYEFTWIEPNYGSALDDSYRGGTSQHPVDDVTGGAARSVGRARRLLRSRRAATGTGSGGPRRRTRGRRQVRLRLRALRSACAGGDRLTADRAWDDRPSPL